MTRRARITWLLNDTAATGRATMAARRMTLLATRHTIAAYYLNDSPPPPRTSLLGGLRPARSLGGEARLARSDIVVTTSESTAGSAVARRSRDTRLVHFLHDPANFALSTVRLMQAVPHLAHVVVPLSVDPAEFATRAGLDPRRVSVMDDFVPAAESLLGTARPRVAVLAGRVTAATRDVVDAFAAALPQLPGWQLRVLGRGPGTAELTAAVDDAGLAGRVLLLGDRYDMARQVLDAGVVIRVNPADVNGLPVLEALAAGVPVLGGSRVPAVTRLVRDGHNGVVLDRIDPDAIAAGLVALADDGHRARLAANARRDRLGLAGPDVAPALHNLVDRILAEPAPTGDLR